MDRNDQELQLNITHCGKTVVLSKVPTADMTVGGLRGVIATQLETPENKTRLLMRGHQLSPTNDDKTLGEVMPKNVKTTILVLASSSATHSSLSHQGEDRLLRNDLPMSTDAWSQRSAKYTGTPRTSTPTASLSSGAVSSYGFAVVEALPNLPEADRAQKLLERLASDRGVQQVMRERRWRVGALREMTPDGRVGVDPVCVLGYNVNRGQEIRLRLRTDDMQGFRSMFQLMHVLAHELAHNVEDEHNDTFKEEMRWVERRMRGVDWRGSGGRMLGDGHDSRGVTSGEIVSRTSGGSATRDDRGGGRRLGGGASGGVSRLLRRDSNNSGSNNNSQ